MFENRPWLLTGHRGMFICSKLGQNISEMEVRTFVRIQKVIWDHLLAFKMKLSRSKLYFSFPVEQHAKNNYELIMQSALFFSFLLFSSPPRSFFRLNQVRNVQKRCSHSRFSFQAIILGFFDWNVGLCCSCFSIAMGDRGCFRWVKQWREVKDQSRGKGGRTQIVREPLQALLPLSPAP